MQRKKIMILNSTKLDKNITKLSQYFYSKYNEDESQKYYGLLTGRSGSTLLQSCIYEHNSDEKLLDIINENVDLIINDITGAEILETAYSAGICGFGLVLNMIKKNLPQDIEDVLIEIDDTLESDLHTKLEYQNFDLIHGAMGTGLYLLDRGRSKPAENVLLALEKNMETNENEIKWRRYDPFNLHTDIYDFGFAHGIAGILYFICKCHDSNIYKEKCIVMIKGIINLYNNNKQNNKVIGSFYPAIIKCSEYSNATIALTRMGWCYGDLMILNTMLIASDVLKDIEMKNSIISMLLETCKRKSDNETYIEDSGFCHGTSGISSICLNLYHKTGIEKFKENSDYWLNKTLEFGVKDEFAGGYSFNKGNYVFGTDITLLNGLAGVLTVMIASKNKIVNKRIARIFFLN